VKKRLNIDRRSIAAVVHQREKKRHNGQREGELLLKAFRSRTGTQEKIRRRRKGGEPWTHSDLEILLSQNQLDC